MNAAAESVEPFTIALRPSCENDMRYLLSSWLEEYKYSSGRFAAAPWAMYRPHVGPQLRAALEAPRVTRIVAELPSGKIAGWIAFTPGKTISAVHWVHTRGALDGVKLRRRGIMSALLEAAELGKRFVYTHKGPKKTKTRGGRNADFDARLTRVVPGSPNTDETIALYLRSRGVTAVYVPYEEWL